jgi:hypothetical protein
VRVTDGLVRRSGWRPDDRKRRDGKSSHVQAQEDVLNGRTQPRWLTHALARSIFGVTTLRRFLARYATCSTYEDRGTCVTLSVYEDGREPSTETLTFATMFDRARRAFRFEYEEPKRWGDGLKRAVIWQPGGGDARLWWNVDHSVRIEPLERAIAAQTEVSSGTAAEVPLLLLGRPLRDTYIDEGIQVEDGVHLRKFTRRKDDYDQTMFISVDDDVLRKYVEHAVISTEGVGLPNLDHLSEEERRELEAALRTPRRFRIERTVRYEPRFDHDIDASRFEFVPPPAPTP